MNGRHKILEKIIDTHYKMVFRICHYVLKDPKYAVEAAQITFQKVFEKTDLIKSGKDITKYIRVAAYDTSKDYLKKKDKSFFFPEPEKQHDEMQLMFLESVILDDHKRILEEALPQIWDEYEDILMLHYYFDLPSKEIAERLNTTEEDIRMRIHRAKERLRKILE